MPSNLTERTRRSGFMWLLQGNFFQMMLLNSLLPFLSPVLCGLGFRYNGQNFLLDKRTRRCSQQQSRKQRVIWLTDDRRPLQPAQEKRSQTLPNAASCNKQENTETELVVSLLFFFVHIAFVHSLLTSMVYATQPLDFSSVFSGNMS